MLLFKTLREKCRLIENLCLEAYQVSDTADAKTGSPLIEFVTNSYNLTSLTLISFRLTDELALNLADVCLLLPFLFLLSFIRYHTIYALKNLNDVSFAEFK